MVLVHQLWVQRSSCLHLICPGQHRDGLRQVEEMNRFPLRRNSTDGMLRGEMRLPSMADSPDRKDERPDDA